jgi:hypothetical protein
LEVEKKDFHRFAAGCAVGNLVVNGKSDKVVLASTAGGD